MANETLLDNLIKMTDTMMKDSELKDKKIDDLIAHTQRLSSQNVQLFAEVAELNKKTLDLANALKAHLEWSGTALNENQ